MGRGRGTVGAGRLGAYVGGSEIHEHGEGKARHGLGACGAWARSASICTGARSAGTARRGLGASRRGRDPLRLATRACEGDKGGGGGETVDVAVG